tara:strand:+ start:2871 stop:3299 length:429 start_codon:yes stop_codon:yes gene_type:complete
MKIAIGCDHAGYEMKTAIIKHLQNKKHHVDNYGTDGPESVDYSDHGHQVCSAIESGKNNVGILICGTANGMTMTANKHKDIRCGLCWLPEIAELIKQHNNANVIALPARFISVNLAIEIVDAYLNAEFEGGRHQKRIDKITC